jgi:penicillin-binding protein activator
MKKTFFYSICGILALALLGCAGSVKRISTDEVVDLSGRWNSTDSQLTAEAMIKDVLSRPWLTKFLKEKGKNPTVIVGTIKNLTDEHIAIDTFQKDMERELTNSGAVEFVAGKSARDEVRAEREDQQTNTADETRKQMFQEQGADYMLQGTLSKITDAAGSKATFYYQVDLELVDMQRNVKVWLGNKKIEKLISRPGARL